MTQLAAEEAAAVGGDPVEPTTDAPEAVVDLPEVSPEGELYPDERQDGEDAGEQPIEDEPNEPEAPAIDAPHSWKAEDKERWNAVPREVQEIIARRETEIARGMTEKSREVEKVKTETVAQAATEISAFRMEQARAIEALAAQFMPQPPDQRLAFSDDPQHHVLYNQQRAYYEQAVAQQQQLQLAARHEMGEAQRIEQELEGQARAADDAKLREAYPEYFDESEAGQKVQAELKSIADELGYSELWDQRNAADVLALRTAAGYKRDALKWRSHDRNQRNPNGTYRAQRAVPPISKPGTTRAGGVPTDDPVKLLYPND